VYIHISWSYPDDNSDPVTSYAIEFRHSDGVSYSQDSDCDGTDPIIIDALNCLVPIQNLRGDPFDLPFDAYVYVRVNSFNSFGWSVDSQPSTGGSKILTEPTKIASPIYDPVLSPNDIIYFNLVELVTYDETGGSDIDSYYVEMSVGDTDIWTVV
jgi:hypothetical protein